MNKRPPEIKRCPNCSNPLVDDFEKNYSEDWYCIECDKKYYDSEVLD